MSTERECGEITYEANSMSGFVDAFTQSVAAFPLGGNIIAGLIQPTYSIRQFRCVPGSTYDYRTFYAKENILAAIVFVLLIITIYFKRK
tara:strand:- start:232 stop:498 length:267 start_codon:yes stop_codon:yes gene_type:complete